MNTAGESGNNSIGHTPADSSLRLSALRKRAEGLVAENKALRQKIDRLVAQNRQLRMQLSTKVTRAASRPDKQENLILALLDKEGQALVRDIARRLGIHPTEVERLLDDLEFEGHVQPRPSVNGTFYSRKSRGSNYLTTK